MGYGANCDAYHFTAPAPDGASGVEGVFTALALHDAFLPATVNLQEPDPELDLDYIPTQWARGAGGVCHERDRDRRDPAAPLPVCFGG